MKKNFTYWMFWAVFLGLLATMLPHTQWAFRQLEPAESAVIIAGFTWADLVATAAAFSFEAGLAVFVHRLSHKIETTRKVYKTSADGTRAVDGWGTLAARYLNIFTAGVLFCAFVSGMANYFHALQFSVPLAAFSKAGFFQELYPLALGAALPVVSLIFASALSNVSEDLAEDEPATVELKTKNTELNKQNRELSQQFSKLQAEFSAIQNKFSDAAAALDVAKAGLSDREQELNQTKELVKDLQGQLNTLHEQLNKDDIASKLSQMDTKDAVMYLKNSYPDLPNAAMAIMVKVSAGRVSQILRDAPIPVSIEPLNVDA